MCGEGFDLRVVQYMKGEGNTLPEYALKVLIMERMGWDHWTYLAQPDYVIDQVVMVMNSEGKAKGG